MGGEKVAGFDEFVTAQAGRLLALAHAVTGEQVSADRLTAASLLLVKRDWRDGESTAERVTAARRRIVRLHLRKTRRGPDDGPGGLQLEDLAFVSASVQPAHEDPRDLWTMLATLAPTERAILVLRHREGLTDNAIAWILRQRPSTIRDTASRASADLGGNLGQRLRGCLSDHEVADFEPEAWRRRLASVAAGGRVAGLRRPRTIAMAAAVALTLLVGGLVYGPDDGDRATPVSRSDGTTVEGAPPQSLNSLGSPAARSPSPGSLEKRRPSAPPGTKLVGYGALMLAVPAGWSRNGGDCELPTLGTVIYPDEVAAVEEPGEAPETAPPCAWPPGPTAYSTVTFESVAAPAGLLRTAVAAGDVNGRAVLITPLARQRGLFERHIAVAADGLVVLVRSPARSVVQSIVRSVSEVPAGYSVVPLCLGLVPDEATLALGLSGLTAQTFADPGGTPDLALQVVAQAPSVGTIVETDSSVALGLLPR